MLNSLVDLIDRLIGVDDYYIARLVIGEQIELWRVIRVGWGEAVGCGRSELLSVEPLLVQLVKTGQVVEVDAVHLLVAATIVQSLQARLWLCAEVEDYVELAVVVVYHPVEPTVQDFVLNWLY